MCSIMNKHDVLVYRYDTLCGTYKWISHSLQYLSLFRGLFNIINGWNEQFVERNLISQITGITFRIYCVENCFFIIWREIVFHNCKVGCSEFGIIPNSQKPHSEIASLLPQFNFEPHIPPRTWNFEKQRF